MDCRLFVDEVGNDDLDHPRERYLSLTGIITKIRGHDGQITQQIEELKAEFFGHHIPDNIVILHRRELVRRDPPYHVLKDAAKNAEWEAAVLGLIDKLPYLAITVLIDKHEHKERYKVWRFNPYHYCMTALVERYVSWLRSHNLTGDVVVEARYKKVDMALKRAFQYFYLNGTDGVPKAVVQRFLTSRELKLAPKSANVAGLQLVELMAHASHHGTRCKYAGIEPINNFGRQIYKLLETKKYRRHPMTMKVDGWGQKWLP